MDLAKIKSRQAATQGGQGRLFKDGATTYIRVFSFTHKVTEADVAARLFPKEKLGKKEIELDRAVTIHFLGGEKNRPILSNSKLMAKYEAVKADQGEEAARKIGPQTKYAINVCDTDTKPRKVRQEMLPKAVYNKILTKMANEKYMVDGVYGAKLIGVNGRDFEVRYDAKAPPANKYDVELRDAEECVKLDPALQESVKDLYSTEGFKSLGLTVQGGDAAADEPEDRGEKEEKGSDRTEKEDGTKAEKDSAREEKEETSTRRKKDTDTRPAKGKGKAKAAVEDNDD